MIDDGIPVAATAPGPLAQAGRRTSDHLVEELPAGLHEADQALDLAGGDRRALDLCDCLGDPEVSGRRTAEALNDLGPRRVRGSTPAARTTGA